ncbi:mycofactocin-coupled SDR family oxidoreductase [Mycolicibacterium thermoresistibile]|uniref:Short-chain dehydrogenase/reductase SDR n=2 Tax=Mycolicibacterium thermoresistibile TaxID=1797 RepID=G7CH28_MYCT3|nr:mycofactocin-coupled SDR family oxidoreductase [Mycolicibacterium thermoresistibile]EHI12138.1 short-chain dehydrogenase/reductase SDR [Mycolicibacterium thermoresistibile ATCC 19527]MCV7191147.1 mycofactocin-coupled SDR family oxidoreductase [Mycolicibacterium thermoresistibile]GAT15505.1 short-chain dehydrogenase/reductase SDR [Mycolicibacterium thermoresistibile]SNW16944.1 short-chain dehydrogenase/reductase SDR [Mycolicibacterium thermoresistibile]
MAGRVAGKVAMITGGGRGQGRSHAVRLAEEGADIVLVDACTTINDAVTYPMATREDLERTAELVRKTGRRVQTHVADVRDFPALKAAADAAVDEFGAIDILCANAGIISWHWSWEIPESAWDDVIDVNLKGVWNSVRAVVPHMMKDRRGGSIVATSSAGGIRGLPYTAHYVASKFGVVGLVKSFANELGQYNIRVNAIHPGTVLGDGEFASAMGTLDPVPRKFFGDYPEYAPNPGHLRDPNADDSVRHAPRPGTDTRDISEAVLWLASDASHFVTGISLPVDDGQVNRQ